MAAEGDGINGIIGGPAVTISLPATGETSEAQLEEDEFHMLWLLWHPELDAWTFADVRRFTFVLVPEGVTGTGRAQGSPQPIRPREGQSHR